MALSQQCRDSESAHFVNVASQKVIDMDKSKLKDRDVNAQLFGKLKKDPTKQNVYFLYLSSLGGLVGL